MTEKLKRKFELWLALHGLKVFPENVSCNDVCKFADTCKKTEKERRPYKYKYVGSGSYTCIRWLDNEGGDE